MSLTELEALQMPAASARFIFEGKAKAAAQDEIQRLEEQNANYITYDSPEYPDRLREIYDPPAVLWYRGDVSILAEPGIAVVGNPAQVAATLQEFVDAGCSTFCLSGYPHAEAARIFSTKVMPYFEGRIADRLPAVA